MYSHPDIRRLCVAQKVGSAIHQELWIPAEDLAEMNRNIVGLIEVVAEYKTKPKDPK